MSFTLRCTALLIVAIVGVTGFGWTDPIHLRVGGVVASVLLFLAVALMWISRTPASSSRHFRESPLREFLLGALTGAGWTGLMLLFFFVVARLPGAQAFFLDHNRESVLRAGSLLVTNGNHQEAADIYLDALNSPHSAEWTLDLATRTVRNLTLAAEHSPQEAEPLLREALRVAKKYGVSADYPRSVMESLAGRNAQSMLQGDIAATQARLKSVDARRQEVERSLETHQRQTAKALVNAHADRLKSVCNATRTALADDLASLGLILEDEVRVAASKDTPTRDGDKLLAEVRSLITARQPQALPAGSQARLLRGVPSPMPGLLLIDIQVTDSAKASISTLRDTDFIARQNGHALRVSSAPLRGGGTLELAIALDRSDSMAGEKEREMKGACIDTLRRLPDAVNVRLTTFGSDVRLVADWAMTRDAAITGCQRLRADGATALFAAIAEAIRSLADRAGQRHALVFSDGVNSVPGPSRDSLIAEARRLRVAVHFIALASVNDDTSDIKTIAAETGGRVLVVANARELTGSFRQIADELTTSGYRIAILDVSPSQPTEIQIGGANAVQLAVPAQDAHQTVAQQ